MQANESPTSTIDLKEAHFLFNGLDGASRRLVEKVLSAERINEEEGVALFALDVSTLGVLASRANERKNGKSVYFNRNFHIEPTNVCVFSCKFCSYSKLYAEREEGWELSKEQMLEKVKSYEGQPITEAHIVGGVHPKLTIDFFCDLIESMKRLRPSLHIKAFTAVELDYMFRKAKMTAEEGIRRLKQSGLDSIPGGGAEIFHPDIRQKICADKASGETWLAIHEAAHKQGVHSNATMLYGHIESYERRIDHMKTLRDLQERTKGFNAFIPLKFLNQNNEMSSVPMVSSIEDMKMYAVARLFMDNFNHIKAYWPMIGKSMSQLSLSFGVDDLDGTIDDSTKIYSMAGAEEQRPAMTTDELISLIQTAGKEAVERDSLYNPIHVYN